MKQKMDELNENNKLWPIIRAKSKKRTSSQIMFRERTKTLDGDRS